MGVEGFCSLRALGFWGVFILRRCPEADGLCPVGAWGMGAGDEGLGLRGKARCLPD